MIGPISLLAPSAPFLPVTPIRGIVGPKSQSTNEDPQDSSSDGVTTPEDIVSISGQSPPAATGSSSASAAPPPNSSAPTASATGNSSGVFAAFQNAANGTRGQRLDISA